MRAGQRTVFITSEWDEDEPPSPLGIYTSPELAMAALDEQYAPQPWAEQAITPDGLHHWRGGSYLWVDEVLLDHRL